jgi:hypothetical protein
MVGQSLIRVNGNDAAAEAYFIATLVADRGAADYPGTGSA